LPVNAAVVGFYFWSRKERKRERKNRERPMCQIKLEKRKKKTGRKTQMGVARLHSDDKSNMSVFFNLEIKSLLKKRE
jgi:hypothetical protein